MTLQSQILDLLRAGVPVSDVAARTGSTPGYVRSVRAEEMVRRYLGGSNVCAIAAEFDLQHSSVGQLLTRRGVHRVRHRMPADVVGPATANPYDDDEWCAACGVVGEERRTKRRTSARIRRQMARAS